MSVPKPRKDREQPYKSHFAMRGCLLLLDITEVTMHRKPHPHSYRRVIPLPGMNRHPTKSYTSQLVCRFLGSQNTSPKAPYEKKFKDAEGGYHGLYEGVFGTQTYYVCREDEGAAQAENRFRHNVIYIRPSFIVLSSNYPDIDTVILSAVC